MLDIYSNEIAATWRSSGAIDLARPHEVWRGVSGGPIARYEAGVGLVYVVGTVKKFDPDGLAGRIYGVPTATLQALALHNNLSLQLSDPVGDRGIVLGRGMLGEVFRGLEDPQREQRAWDWVSNLFFQGYDMVGELQEVIRSPREFSIDRSDLAFIHYHLARLLMKRGASRAAQCHLKASLLEAAGTTQKASHRLRALVDARTLADQVDGGSFSHWHREMEDVRRGLGEIKDAPESYIAGEIASLLGWLGQKVMLGEAKPSFETLQIIAKLIIEHKHLMSLDPSTMPKQQVVSTALTIHFMLRSLHENDAVALLEEQISLGFAQARARRNSIFFIQMLLCRAIAMYLAGARRPALALFLFVGRLLRARKLSLEHEGIAQLYQWLPQLPEECARVVAYAHASLTTAHPSEDIRFLVTQRITREDAGAIVQMSGDWRSLTLERQALHTLDPSYFLA